MIHLKHAIHGYHIVYTETEAKACEKTGWKRCDIKKEHEEARKEKGFEVVKEQTVQSETPKRKYTKRFSE